MSVFGYQPNYKPEQQSQIQPPPYGATQGQSPGAGQFGQPPINWHPDAITPVSYGASRVDPYGTPGLDTGSQVRPGFTPNPNSSFSADAQAFQTGNTIYPVGGNPFSGWGISNGNMIAQDQSLAFGNKGYGQQYNADPAFNYFLNRVNGLKSQGLQQLTGYMPQINQNFQYAAQDIANSRLPDQFKTRYQDHLQAAADKLHERMNNAYLL